MKDVSLIELMIIIAIAGIVFSATIGIVSQYKKTVQVGDTICKSGYLWNIDLNGHQRQVLNENGGGIKCQ